MPEDIKKKIEEIAYDEDYSGKKKKYKGFKKGFTRKYKKYSKS